MNNDVGVSCFLGDLTVLCEKKSIFEKLFSSGKKYVNRVEFKLKDIKITGRAPLRKITYKLQTIVVMSNGKKHVIATVDSHANENSNLTIQSDIPFNLFKVT